MINPIKKFMCKQHKLVTSRKGLRKHIYEKHARNEFTKEEGIWHSEEFVTNDE